MKILIVSLFILQFHSARADNFINGEILVVPGETHTYTANHPDWNNTYENYANVSWTVTNGTIISSNKTSVTITWDLIPQWLNAEGTIEYYEDLGGMGSGLVVEIRNFIEGITAECNGILGLPASFVDFGSGSNPGPPISSGSISYQYKAACNVRPGEYSVSNNTIGCNGGWRTLLEDHTPNDVNGYMLVIDGDDKRGEIYRTTINNLTQAFGYEFSAYIVNLGAVYEKPRVQFEIYDMSGRLIGGSGSFAVDYDANNPWKRLSFMFDLPAGTTSVQIVLVNKNNDELGNDFAVDDISFAPCYPPILASFSSVNIVEKAYTCNNGIVQLFSRWPTPTIPFTNPGFQWQRSSDNGTTWQDINGAISLSFSQTEAVAGIFKYRIITYDINNPTQTFFSNVITYYVQKIIVTASTYNFYSCNPVPGELRASYFMQYADTDLNAPLFNYSFNWSPANLLSSSTISNPIISLPTLTPPPIGGTAPPPSTYNYNLTITNQNFSGCNSSAPQVVNQYNPRKVAIYSGFTPNGDNVNDLFRPLNIQDYPGSEFWVYNRFGNLVFYSNGPTLANYSWDGRYGGQPADAGTYTWRINVVGCPTNIQNSNGTTNPFGTVVLIR